MRRRNYTQVYLHPEVRERLQQLAHSPHPLGPRAEGPTVCYRGVARLMLEIGCLEVHDRLERGRLQDRQIGGLCASRIEAFNAAPTRRFVQLN